MSSQKPSGLFRKPPSALRLRRLFNWWPTFLFSGIKVRRISDDFTHATVELKLGLLNKNYVGTAFGGSLFAMTDPFWMIMMIRQLGPGYVVWDRSAGIRFLKPGRGTIRAEFHLPAEEVERVRQCTVQTGRYDPSYTVQLLDLTGEVVAEVEKTLYVRKLKTD